MTRRLVIRVIVFLLLGAIVNVAVAWGFGNAPMLGKGAICETFLSPTSDPAGQWMVQRREGPAASRVVSHWFFSPIEAPTPPATRLEPEQALPSWASFAHRTYDRDPSVSASMVTAHAQGWPLRALCGGFSQELRAGRWSITQTIRCIVLRNDRVHGANPNSKVLTTKVIWPGFAINTIFYAAILWLVFATPGTVKRVRRRRRGQCPACGYDLRGHLPGADSIKCPECGRFASR